nr:synaptic vesicle glycoprotein 2B-like [Onthophagus taurus]
MKPPKMMRKNEEFKSNTNQNSIFEADFETAISATKFGKFNLLLILIAVPCGWATVCDATTMSYILPSVYCDLGLNLEQRGMLNAITYFGMISSAFLWGFLSDTLGRKKLLIIGFALDAFFIIVAGLSQTYEMILAAKYMTGFIINGPFAAFTTVLSEFHAKQYRAKVMLILGIIYAVGNLILPLMAWLILPTNWKVIIVENKFELRPWNFFIILSSLPSILSCISHLFIPESPKFLMTTGRNEEALQVLQKVYALNTGKSKKSYPIQSLIDEIKESNTNTVTANRSSAKALKEGFLQMKPLIQSPHLKNLTLTCLIQTGFLTSLNTLRLWLPQLYTTINDYQTAYPDDKDANLCTMLGSITSNVDVSQSECLEFDSRDSVYFNVVIINIVNMIFYTLAGIFINKLGKKTILIFLGILGTISGVSIYFAQSVATTTTLTSLSNASLGVCSNILITIVIDLFPTTLRTIAVSMVMMAGRSGSMVGNITFPMLLQLGCWEPFFTIGGFVLVSTVITFFLPKTDMKSLE